MDPHYFRLNKVGPAFVWMTVGFASGVASTNAAPPEAAGMDLTSRAICRIRAGTEGIVRSTITALGLGGANLEGAITLAEHAGLAETLSNLSVVSADSQFSWPHSDPCVAIHSHLGQYVIIESLPGTPVQALVQALSVHTDVFESVEADAPGSVLGIAPPNDQYFNLQYGLNNTGAPVGGNPGVPHADIAALSAWELAGGTRISIAVLDTGVSQSHPDLAPKLVEGRNFVGPDPTATDDSLFLPHGTACAGIAAAASNDGLGISGVSWNARIMPVRVVDQWGNSSEVTCANGIIWAVDHGARVISISLGFTAGTDYLHAAVAYATSAGAVIVAASGNTPGVPVYFPARWPEVLAVSATDNSDVIGPFCTTGPEVDVCAPGVSILTTTDSNAQPNSYRYETGTSMATPFVSGIASLLLETAPWLSSAEVRRIIKDTADDRGPTGWDPQYGFGRVNAGRALQSLSGDDQVCLADWNADGIVTASDLFAFLTSFFAGRGDVNGDGQTTMADLFEFMNRYSLGC